MEDMNLSNGGFSGNVPEIFEGMTELRTISFSNNSFTGLPPSSLGNSDSLSSFFMTNTSFAGCFPSNWQNICDNTLYTPDTLYAALLPAQGDMVSFCNSMFGMCQDANNCHISGDTLLFLPTDNALGWNNPSHWNLKRAPDHCDSVIIQSSKFPVVPDGTQAYCRYLELKDSSRLTIEGFLEVNQELINNGQLINRGVLHMDSFGMAGIRNYNFISNEEFGAIEIEGLASNTATSIINESGAIINNNGNIKIQNLVNNSAKGILNKSGATLTNHSNLIFKNIKSNPLINEGLLSNYDSIVIHNITIGSGIRNKDTLINKPDGIIEMNLVNANGITNLFDHIVETEYFLNQGNILLRNIGNDAVSNHQTFINDSCGVLEITAGIYNQDLFVNRGLIIQEFDDDNNFIDTLYNEGIYVDRYDTTVTTPFFKNSGLYMSEISGTLFCNNYLAGIFSGPNIQNLTTSQIIYQDSTLNVEVGEISLINNRLMVNPQSIGEDKLYFNLTHSNNCGYNVPLFFENALQCSNYVIWKGWQDSLWTNPFNWFPSHVPNLGDHVIIPSESEVLIPHLQFGRAKTLEIQLNVDFNVVGTLEVSGQP